RAQQYGPGRHDIGFGEEMTTAAAPAENAGTRSLTPPPVGPSRTHLLRSWSVFGVLVVVLLGTVAAMFMPLKPQAIGCAALVMMLTLLLLRLPVALTMIIPSFAGLYALRGEKTVASALSSLPYHQVASWTLSVVPMFVLMGLLMWRS